MVIIVVAVVVVLVVVVVVIVVEVVVVDPLFRIKLLTKKEKILIWKAIEHFLIM